LPQPLGINLKTEGIGISKPFDQCWDTSVGKLCQLQYFVVVFLEDAAV